MFPKKLNHHSTNDEAHDAADTENDAVNLKDEAAGENRKRRKKIVCTDVSTSCTLLFPPTDAASEHLPYVLFSNCISFAKFYHFFYSSGHILEGAAPTLPTPIPHWAI